MDKHIKAIADSGCKVVVTGGKVGDLALHFCNRYGLMVVRIMSKFDLRRIAKMTGAVALQQITAPTAEELGHCDYVFVDEMGDTPIIVFKQNAKESSLSTIVLRGATENSMDDVERAIDDGVNAFKTLTKDARILPGAGASEIELAMELSAFAQKQPGLEQYAIKKFAEALEEVPNRWLITQALNQWR